MDDSSGEVVKELVGTWQKDGEVRDYYRVSAPGEVMFFYLVRDSPSIAPTQLNGDGEPDEGTLVGVPDRVSREVAASSVDSPVRSMNERR